MISETQTPDSNDKSFTNFSQSTKYVIYLGPGHKSLFADKKLSKCLKFTPDQAITALKQSYANQKMVE